jgi:FkbM family methyltransferase
MNLIKTFQRLFLLFGINISREPLKYYYDLEDEIRNSFAKQSTGILHIGAHYGQESQFYAKFGIKVIWIEAIPEVFEILKTNITNASNQTAICALVGDKNQQIDFYLSNNLYSASSIYKLSEKSGFKKVVIERKITLPMTTLDDLFPGNTLNTYNHWIIDVQGSEMSVLRGGRNSLKYCKSIQIEVSTRETYINGSKYLEIRELLSNEGFVPLWEPRIDDHTDLIFIKSYKYCS